MIVAQAAGAVGTGEAIVFWILGPIALAGALGMVFARNAVHSALMLVVTMFCLAVFYIAGQAHAHSSQPTHFSSPSGCRLSWWRPW